MFSWGIHRDGKNNLGVKIKVPAPVLIRRLWGLSRTRLNVKVLIINFWDGIMFFFFWT